MFWLFSHAPNTPSKDIAPSTPLLFYNTLSKSVEEFSMPPHIPAVRMYNCGPTVYDRQHIGNLSMFVFTDVLRRALEYNGYKVKQVINITDVGHLSSDADEGEDKMTKGLTREGLALTLENMKVLAEKYTAVFQEDLRALNIDTASILFPRASEHIGAQIAMIQTLMDKGYAYRGSEGVYFNTAHFSKYGQLGGVDLAGLEAGARVEVSKDKHNPTDFLLWKFDDALGWDSPWGKGFPGWHIECSAMIRKTLGEKIDIHTGGIEHIPVHHNNEIAQSEAAIGKSPLSRFWMHRAHIQFKGGKLAKSQGNVIYLSDITAKGISPLALRYLFLGAHYRTNANFSWEALEASATALSRLSAFAQEDGGAVSEKYRTKFLERINDDLDTPGALAVLWEVTKDGELSAADISATLRDADKVLGLGLSQIKSSETIVNMADLPEEARAVVEEREKVRRDKEWEKADMLRAKLGELGFEVKDTPTGPEVRRKS